VSTETTIADLEAILDAGGSRVTVDGLSVQYDLDQVRKRLAELRRSQDAAKRPRVATIDLSNF
jgi:hypothetical protein